jgi:hypothetical protein
VVLALIFAELLAGGVLIVSGITGHTPTETIKGETKPFKSILEKTVVPGVSEKETTESFKGSTGGLESFDGSNSENQNPLGKTQIAPAPSTIKVPKTLNYKRLEELTKKGGPKGHLTSPEITKILKGETTLAEAEKALGI